MSQVSNPPLAGALLGLIFGLLEYVIAMTMFRAHVSREVETARKAGEPLPGIEFAAARMRMIRHGLLALALIVYPVMGYAIARMFFT